LVILAVALQLSKVLPLWLNVIILVLGIVMLLCQCKKCVKKTEEAHPAEVKPEEPKIEEEVKPEEPAEDFDKGEIAKTPSRRKCSRRKKKKILIFSYCIKTLYHTARGFLFCFKKTIINWYNKKHLINNNKRHGNY